MRYRLIACDMDETLLNDRHEICERNVEAIKRAKKEYGVKFVPATGRGFTSVQGDLKTLGLYDEPGEYVISFNGGALTENRGNQLLAFQGLEFEKMKKIFSFGIGKDVCIHVYTKDALYLYQLGQEEGNRLKRLGMAFREMKENTVDFLEKTPIAKILFQNTDAVYLRRLEQEMGEILSGCCVSYSSNRYMEMNAMGVDKGRGLKHLAELLGIDSAQTIAVGDNYNDMAMLKAAGLSVAAGNAVEDVKQACDYTTKADNNEGVVAELIEKFIFH